MKTHHCTICGREHSLFYWREKEDRVLLCYRCDKGEFAARPNRNGDLVPRSFMRTIRVNYVAGLDIPEEWSGVYRKKKQAEQELQLPMMIAERKEKD